MKVPKAVVAGVAAAVLAASPAMPAATKIKKTELPEPVRETVDRLAPAGHVVACWGNVAGRGGVYEVDVKVNGRKKGFVIAADGEVLILQEETTWDDLPEAVRRSFRREAGDHDVEEVHRLEQHGEIVGYVARIDGDERDYEFRVGPEGDPPQSRSETATHFRERWRERSPKRAP